MQRLQSHPGWKLTAVVLLALVLLPLPVSAYLVCIDVVSISSGGGCSGWRECDIYSDATGAWVGSIRGPIQQCG